MHPSHTTHQSTPCTCYNIHIDIIFNTIVTNVVGIAHFLANKVAPSSNTQCPHFTLEMCRWDRFARSFICQSLRHQHILALRPVQTVLDSTVHYCNKAFWVHCLLHGYFAHPGFVVRVLASLPIRAAFCEFWNNYCAYFNECGVWHVCLLL